MVGLLQKPGLWIDTEASWLGEDGKSITLSDEGRWKDETVGVPDAAAVPDSGSVRSADGQGASSG